MLADLPWGLPGEFLSLAIAVQLGCGPSPGSALLTAVRAVVTTTCVTLGLVIQSVRREVLAWERAVVSWGSQCYWNGQGCSSEEICLRILVQYRVTTCENVTRSST